MPARRTVVYPQGGGVAGMTTLAYAASQSPANGGGIMCGSWTDLFATTNSGGGKDCLSVYYHGIYNGSGIPTDASAITIGKTENNASNPGTDSGKAPLLLGFQLTTTDGISLGFPYTSYSIVPLMNSFGNAGGIPVLGMWMVNPLQYHNGVITQQGSMSANNLLNVSSSVEYTVFRTFLTQLISLLQQITVPFWLRLPHEQNLNGSWWWDLSNFNSAQQVSFFQLIVNTIRGAGITNVRFIYNANAGAGGYIDAYPGDSYVDINSGDAYPVNVTGTTSLYTALTTPATTINSVAFSGTKPYFFAEAGQVGNPATANTLDLSAVLSWITANYPKCFGMMEWFQGSEYMNQTNGSAAVAAMITRDQAPRFTGA